MSTGPRDANLESAFLQLFRTGYEITSEATAIGLHPKPYNCIAWAAGDKDRWWQDQAATFDVYWPPVQNDGTLEALVRAFEWIGYRRCATAKPERGYQKVALYGTCKL